MTSFWHDIRLLHATANALMMAAFAALVASAIVWAVHRPQFDLDEVEVVPVDGQAFRHVTVQALRAADLGRLDGNFFTVDLQAVRTAFEAAPWVRHAQVRRIWPNRLRVTIEERVPLATWEDGGLVDVHGEWFDPEPGRPARQAALVGLRFAGPEGMQGVVREHWLELLRELEPLHLRPVALRVSDRLAWSATLDNGVELQLGRETEVPILERVARWKSVYAKLEARLRDEIQVFDLRYPNGFAVRAPAAFAADVRSTHRAARDAAPAREPTRKP